MKAYHTLVAGDSGGGKTTLMRELHATFPGLSVWVNHNGETNVSGSRASGMTAMRNAQQHTINLRVSDVNDGSGMAREFAREWYERTGYPSQIIVDEAQADALPDGASVPDTPLRHGLHEDRDHAVKWVVATQDPSDLHYTPLKQCRYFCWCGEPAKWHKGFLDWWGIPDENLPSRDYEFVKMDKRMDVVYRGETKRKYG